MRLSIAVSVLFFLFLCSTAQADANQALGSDPLGGAGRTTLTRSFEPSFRIEPVVQRYRARRGEVVPFSFEIQSTGRTMNVNLQAVDLRQEESGVILHDDSDDAAPGVKFTSATDFQLTPGDKFFIEGEVTVPLSRTNFISFGILVRDSGQLNNNAEAADDGTTKAAIKFVTQYVLRVDIETGAQDIGDMDQLRFDTGTVTERDGLPWIVSHLNNPTDFALECNVRATLVATDETKSQPVSLIVPAREALTGEDRTLVRIMPRSRLRLEAPLEQAIVDGDYQLNLELSNGRRVMVASEFPAHIESSRYRALQTKIQMLGGGVSISPTQIELGRIEGLQRMTTVTLNNPTEEPRTVTLSARDANGEKMVDLKLSTEKVLLPPGRSKTIRLLLTGKPTSPYQWGWIDAQCDASDATSTTIPMEITQTARPVANIHVDELQWATGDSDHGFVLRVENNGDGYEPIHAKLQLASADKQPITVVDGFGAWLAPKEAKELHFVIPRDTTPGTYQVTLEVQGRDLENPTAQRTIVFELTPEMLKSPAPATL